MDQRQELRTGRRKRRGFSCPLIKVLVLLCGCRKFKGTFRPFKLWLCGDVMKLLPAVERYWNNNKYYDGHGSNNKLIVELFLLADKIFH